jgi:hypothetical protein
MTSKKSNKIENKTEVYDIMSYIEKTMKECYPNMPIHKMNRLMRVFKEMDKSDWVEGEIIMPSNNHLPKDFWKI